VRLLRGQFPLRQIFENQSLAPGARRLSQNWPERLILTLLLLAVKSLGKGPSAGLLSIILLDGLPETTPGSCLGAGYKSGALVGWVGAKMPPPPSSKSLRPNISPGRIWRL